MTRAGPQNSSWARDHGLPAATDTETAALDEKALRARQEPRHATIETITDSEDSEDARARLGVAEHRAALLL